MNDRQGPPELAAVGRVRAYLAALLLYVALAFLLTAAAWGDPTNRWAGSCCDPEQSMWFLAWMPSAIQHGANPFVTTHLNAPLGVNLMWNTSMPLVTLVLTPVTLAAGPVFAYNVAIVAAIALSALAAFGALRHLLGGIAGPLVGGALYGLSPYMASHAALHLDLVAAWAPPLFLVLVVELLVHRRYAPARLGIALGLIAGLQLLTFEEVLATTAIAMLVLAAVLAALASDRATIGSAIRRVAIAFVPATVAFGVVGAWPLAVQFLGPQRISGRLQDASVFSTDLLNLVVPTRYQLVAPDAATAISGGFSGLYHEATAYVGLPLLVVLVVAVARHRHDPRVRVAVLAGLAMLVLSLGPVLHVGGTSTGVPMPWQPISHLPLLEHALPGRLTLYVWLAVAVVMAVVIDGLAAGQSPGAIARLAAVGLAIATIAPAPLVSSGVEVPEFFRSWARQGVADDAVVLVAPYFTDGAGASPMVWAAVAQDRPRLYEAYAFVPAADGAPSYGPPRTQLTDIMTTIQDTGMVVIAAGAVRDQALRDLSAAGITDVIVGPMDRHEQMVAFFTDLFGRPPVNVDGVAIWRGIAAAG